jgi:transposase-like protein
MGKMKELVIEVCEEYESGLSIEDISNLHGVSIDYVINILKQFSLHYG